MSPYTQYPIRRNKQSDVGVPFIFIHKYRPIGQMNNSNSAIVRYAWIPDELWHTDQNYPLSTHLGLACLSFVKFCRKTFEREINLDVGFKLDEIFDIHRIKVVWNGVGAYGRGRLAKLPLRIKLSATTIEPVEVHLPVNPFSEDGYLSALRLGLHQSDIPEPIPVQEIDNLRDVVEVTGENGNIKDIWNEKYEYIAPEVYFWRDSKTMAFFAFIAYLLWCSCSNPLYGLMPTYFHAKNRLGVGDVVRYNVIYSPYTDTKNKPDNLYFHIRNTSSPVYRAAYLVGPYMFSASVTSTKYHPHKSNLPVNRPQFDPEVKAGSCFTAKFVLGEGRQQWIVDVQSQIIFTRVNVSFEFCIGNTMEWNDKYVSTRELSVICHNTHDLWKIPLFPHHTLDAHLVVLTHGLHSNVTADLFYLKQRLERTQGILRKPNGGLVVVGYPDNVCQTERGIKYLGTRVAHYVMQQASSGPCTQISFIGHSLGGLVQTFAIGYIHNADPTFFKRITPRNFIALSTPFLGISHENPAFVKVALDFGVVGKTGHDLGLSPRLNGKKPLLQLMAMQNSKCHEAIRMFNRHTIYANVINDGIVPLRTSAMFFLDWMGLSKLEKQRRGFWTGGGVEYNELGPAESNSSGISNSTAEDAIARHGSVKGQARPGSSKRRLSIRCLHKRSSSHSFHNPTTGKCFCFSQEESPELQKTPSSSSNKPIKQECENKSPIEALFGLLRLSPASTTKSPSTSQEESLNSKPPQRDASDNPLGPLITFLRPAGGRNPTKHEESSSTSTGPLDTIQTYLQVRKKPSKTLSRSQTVNSTYNLTHKPIPGYSFLESASDLFNPPVPPESFLLNPSTRKEVIFHDRVYEPEDIPVGSGTVHQEERIARDWHTDISWRKVLVKLNPEAHNNIIVRREFSNAWGWGVVEHLVREHFESDKVRNFQRRSSSVSELTPEEGTFSEIEGETGVA